MEENDKLSFKIEIQGDKELARLLSNAPAFFRLVADEGCRLQTEQVVKTAKAICPYKTGALRDSIVSQKATGGFGGRSIGSWAVKVGVYYGKFVEYGTRYMTGRYYLRNAFLMVKPDFNRIMSEQIRNYWRSNHK